MLLDDRHRFLPRGIYFVQVLQAANALASIGFIPPDETGLLPAAKYD
jgi:hypothetical protein